MKIRYNREIISGAIFVVLSAVLWFLIPVQVQTLEKTPINAQTFPRIAIGGMFLCSVGLLLEGIFVREKQELYVTKESFRSNAFKRNAFRSVRIAFDRLLFPDWTSGLYCLHNPAGTGGHDVL